MAAAAVEVMEMRGGDGNEETAAAAAAAGAVAVAEAAGQNIDHLKHSKAQCASRPRPQEGGAKSSVERVKATLSAH